MYTYMYVYVKYEIRQAPLEVAPLAGQAPPPREIYVYDI